MKYIKLEKLNIVENKVEYSFSVSEELDIFFDKEKKMFVEFDIDISDIPKSILVIPFVANMAPLVWLTNSNLWIEEVDRRYYDSLYRVKNSYQNMYPHYKFGGNIISAKTVYNKYNIERSAVQLFSGGLDAITTTIRISDKEPILINIFGWCKNDKENYNIFESDKKNISIFSKKNNLESNFIKSNFAIIINSKNVDNKYKKNLKDSWWHGLQHGMSFIGHAIPLAYKYKAEDIYIASSYALDGVRNTCSSDPAVDIEIKYASGGVVHDGFELNRQQKLSLIVNKQKEIKSDYPLRVCSFNDRNCCKCEKCFRTILGLIAEGADIKKFGFEINGDIKKHFVDLMDNNIQFWGVEKESRVYWPMIRKRMLENKNNIQEKEFVEWFLNYDFLTNRKKALLKYRVENFIPIIKRKIFGKYNENNK